MTNFGFVLAIVLGLALILVMWTAILARWATAGVMALYSGLLVGPANCARRRSP